MTYNMLVAQKKKWKYRTRKSPDGQNVFTFYRPASSKLRDSFTMVFAQNSSILYWAVHQPSLFHNFEVSRGGLNWSLKNYGFICDAIFLNLYACTQIT